MLEGTPDVPRQQTVLEKTQWLRAERGGFLQFHIKPGDAVEQGQAVATNTNLLGVEKNVVYSPFTGIVLGMTTLPAVTPGEPICHIGRLPLGMQPQKLARRRNQEQGLEGRLIDELATNFHVIEREDESG